MLRKMITPDIVAEIERLLAAGCKAAEVAQRLKISCYVVEIIAHDPDPRDGPVRPLRSKTRIVYPKEGIEYGTIRMIERALEVGQLSHCEIAREFGVSTNIVFDVACGRRIAINLIAPHLNRGEKFLKRPIRCGTCRAKIKIVPCRACRILRDNNFA